MSDILKMMNYDLDSIQITGDLIKSSSIEPTFVRLNVKLGIQLIDGAKMPDYASSDDSGADLYVLHDVYIAPNERGVKVRTGVKLDIPNGFEVQVRPKSGVSTKTPLRVILGTVDSGYKGEIMIMVDNMSDQPVEIPKHKAIAQIVLQSVPMMVFEERDEFSKSERGENGFGSTGRGI